MGLESLIGGGVLVADEYIRVLVAKAGLDGHDGADPGGDTEPPP